MIFPVRQASDRFSEVWNLPVRRGLKLSKLKPGAATFDARDLRGIHAVDPRQPRWTAETGRLMITTSTARFSAKVIEALHRWPVAAPTGDELIGMIGRGVHRVNVLASNMTLKVRVGDAFAAMTSRISTDHPDLNFYFCTIIDDKARTYDRATMMDLEPLQKRVRKIMESAGIENWFGIVDFEGETNSQALLGRAIIPHVHLLFWLRGRFKPKKVATELSKSRRLDSATDAPTVTIKRRRNPGSVAYTCFYMNKAPKGSNLIPSSRKPAGWVRREAELRPNHAVRIVEALSHYNLSELLISGGNGMRIRKHLIATIIHYRDTPTAYPQIERDSTYAIWARARRAAKRDRYGPVRVIRKRPATEAEHSPTRAMKRGS